MTLRSLAGFVGLSFAAAGTFAVGCGGTDGPIRGAGGEGGGGAGGEGALSSSDTGPRQATDCSLGEGLEFALVDDFELGAATGAYTNNEVCEGCRELEGKALFSCQEDCAKSQYPTDFDKPLPAGLVPDGRCDSRYALHMLTQNFHDWGGQVGFPFGPAFDARGYEGVAFWGRVAWGTRSTIRVAVVDPETDSTFRDSDTGRARCEEDNTLDVFQNACDAFGGYAVMNGDWKLFLIPFAEMRQRGFGHIAPFLDLGAVRQISIEYSLGAWDFWLDDLSFYRHVEAAQ